MTIKPQINRILGIDWLKYHPYDKINNIDKYYIDLCDKVLKILQQPEFIYYVDTTEDKKALACILVSYFEDIISETHLFSAFTNQHKKMYGRELPFYTITDDYYSDEVNKEDIYFLIWYYTSVKDEDMVFDPYFENSQEIEKSVSKIFNLFENEFENAPQNEKLQDFLQLSTDSDVKTVRDKFCFIAYKSFFWKPVFEVFFEEMIEEYKENDNVVLDEEDEAIIYDKRINFIYNHYLPLLSMRVNEYYAEILGETHSEYSFIKNISKRIFGNFIIRKIEDDGFLLEHFSSKKQIKLSNEFTNFGKNPIIENETILSIGLVQWKNDIWQNQGVSIIHNIKDIKKIDFSDHVFDDDNKKKEFLHHFEKAFMEVSNNNRIVYVKGIPEYKEFQYKVIKQHTKNLKPDIDDKEFDKTFKHDEDIPFKSDEAIGFFFNPNCGMELYRENIVRCISDKNNPYYTHEDLDFRDIIIDKSVSVEFLNYLLENNLLNVCIIDFNNANILNIIMENLDFLLRFYRRGDYFSKPAITQVNRD